MYNVSSYPKAFDIHLRASDISHTYKLSWRYKNISLYNLCFGPGKDLFFRVFTQHVGVTMDKYKLARKYESAAISFSSIESPLEP